MSTQCTKLENAILCVIGFSRNGSHKNNWGGWQSSVLHFTERFTRRSLEGAFNELLTHGLIEITNTDGSTVPGEHRAKLFHGEFRAALTPQGHDVWRALKPGVFGGLVRVAGAG